MDQDQRQQGIGEYASRIIRLKARQMVGKAGFTREDVEDLVQEMTLDLLRRLPRFDPSKAAYNTFVAQVVERKLINLIRYRVQGKRDYRREACSVNDPIPDGQGGTVERSQAISEDDYARRLGRCSRSDREEWETAYDLAAIITKLPDHLRTLCERLQTVSIADIAKKSDIPRSTLNDQVKTLREIFEKAGFCAISGRPPSFRNSPG